MQVLQLSFSGSISRAALSETRNERETREREQSIGAVITMISSWTTAVRTEI